MRPTHFLSSATIFSAAITDINVQHCNILIRRILQPLLSMNIRVKGCVLLLQTTFRVHVLTLRLLLSKSRFLSFSFFPPSFKVRRPYIFSKYNKLIYHIIIMSSVKSIKNLQNKKIAILGLGLENLALVRYILKHKIKCQITICDKREDVK